MTNHSLDEKMETRQVSSSKRSKDIQVRSKFLETLVLRHSYNIFPVLFQDINDDDCEELEPGSGSIHSGNPVRSHKSKPNSLNLKGKYGS